MATHRVSQRGSILQGSKLYQPGERIPDGTFTGEQVKAHVKSGFLVKVGADDDFGNDPGVKPVPSEIDLSKGETNAPKTNDPNSSKTMEQVAKLQHIGKWNRDPKSLEGMDLEALNIVVIDIDHEVKPFKTKKEAIGWLSQDFHG